jgi:hypothetical protein
MTLSFAKNLIAIIVGAGFAAALIALIVIWMISA